jgi:hypothetical protein
MALLHVYVVFKKLIGTCHGHESNKVNKIFYIKTRTKACLIQIQIMKQEKQERDMCKINI